MDFVGFGPLRLEYVYEIKDPLYVSDLGIEEGDEVLWKGRKEWLLRDRLLVFGRHKATLPDGGLGTTLAALSGKGYKVGLIGLVGRDKEGEELLGHLKSLDVTRVLRKGKTDVSYVVLRHGHRPIRVLVQRDSQRLKKEQIDFPYLQGAKWIHFVPFTDNESVRLQLETKGLLEGKAKVSFDLHCPFVPFHEVLMGIQGAEVVAIKGRALKGLEVSWEQVAQGVKVLLVVSEVGLSLYRKGREEIGIKGQEFEGGYDFLVGVFLSLYHDSEDILHAFEGAVKAALFAHEERKKGNSPPFEALKEG